MPGRCRPLALPAPDHLRDTSLQPPAGRDIYGGGDPPLMSREADLHLIWSMGLYGGIMKGHAIVVKPEVDPSRRSLDGIGDHLAQFGLAPSFGRLSTIPHGGGGLSIPTQSCAGAVSCVIHGVYLGIQTLCYRFNLLGLPCGLTPSCT